MKSGSIQSDPKSRPLRLPSPEQRALSRGRATRDSDVRIQRIQLVRFRVTGVLNCGCALPAAGVNSVSGCSAELRNYACRLGKTGGGAVDEENALAEDSEVRELEQRPA